MYQETVHLLQPTVLALRVCGVCPSALRRLHIPTSNKIYGLLLALPPLVYAPVVIIILYQSYNDITSFSKVLGCLLVTAQHAVFILRAFLTSGSLVRFFMIMESAQQTLFQLNISQPHTPTVKSQLLWLILLFALVVIDTVLQISLRRFLLSFILLPMALVTIGTICKIRVLLELVNDKFALLNWHLDDLNNRWPLFLPRPPDVSFRELTSVAQWRRTKFVNNNQDTRTLTAEKVRDFNKAHLKLHYAYTTLNSVFSWEAFFLSLTSALNIVTLMFDMFSSQNSSNQRTFFNSLPNLIQNVMTFVVVLTLATMIENKSKKTALLVHDLLDEDSHSPEVVEELEQFSLALLHRNTSMSAAGFFDFNLKLVSKMASILAPVILFLVQNDNRPRAGRNRHNT